MANRREILQVGAAMALPLSAHADWITDVHATTGVPLDTVVYDSRFPAARHFGAQSRSLGHRTREFSGDMTSVWYDDLYHRWRQAPAAIAGMTTAGALFCFEQLALDHRMRPVFRAEHRVVGDGSVAHRMTGPAALLSLAVHSVAAEADLGRSLAALVTQCPGTGPASSAEFRSTGGDMAEDTVLYSWVIAPSVRA